MIVTLTDRFRLGILTPGDREELGTLIGIISSTYRVADLDGLGEGRPNDVIGGAIWTLATWICLADELTARASIPIQRDRLVASALEARNP